VAYPFFNPFHFKSLLGYHDVNGKVHGFSRSSCFLPVQRESAGEALGCVGIEEHGGKDEGTEATTVRERVIREEYKLGVHKAEVREGRKLCE
jgi:hypothetical protein